MAPSNHTKMERNLMTVLTHGRYKELMESKLSETCYSIFYACHYLHLFMWFHWLYIQLTMQGKYLLKYNYWAQELLKGNFYKQL